MSGPNTTVTRANILAGPGQLWYGIFGAVTIPPDTDISVAVNASPTASAGWVDAGVTDGGLTVVTNQTFFEYRPDQIADVVLRRMTERDVQVQTNLAEGTLENLAVALNMDPADVVTGSGFKKLNTTNGISAMFLDEFSIIIDGWAPGTQKRRRVVLRRVNSIENVESGYLKDGIWMTPVTMSASYVDSITSPVEYIDES